MSYFGLYKKVCWQLLCVEFIELRKTFFSQALNLAIWVFCSVVVLSYLLSAQMAIDSQLNFGLFTFAGCVATVGIFDAYGNMYDMVSDLKGSSILSYYLILPIPSWFVFIVKMIYWAIYSLLKAFVALAVGKLVLWNQFYFSDISVVALLVVLMASNLFYGTFSLFVISVVQNMYQGKLVWMRFIFPLWFFGGFQFSWFIMYKLAPPLAYCVLFNPVIYAMESTRAVIFGGHNYLAWPACVGMLCLFSITCAIVAIARMKKRLDFV